MINYYADKENIIPFNKVIRVRRETRNDSIRALVIFDRDLSASLTGIEAEEFLSLYLNWLNKDIIGAEL